MKRFLQGNIPLRHLLNVETWLHNFFLHFFWELDPLWWMLAGWRCMYAIFILSFKDIYVYCKKMHSSFLGLGKYNFMVHFASSVCIGKWTYVCFSDIGSVALLWRNANCNVNSGLSYFEWCSLACMCLLANLYLLISVSSK